MQQASINHFIYVLVTNYCHCSHKICEFGEISSDVHR